ncbi:MAG: hypothetical protein ACR2QE_19990 [Acidimicrobiales bacterium]
MSAPATGPTEAADPAVHEVRITRGAKVPPAGLLTRIGVAALVVALLGAGLVAVQGFGSTGGAESPEQAVAELLQAVGNEDFLGAAEVVEPAERRTLVEPAIDIVGELKRLDVLAEDFDLGAIAGVDYEFADMTYTPEILGPRVARVGVDGTVSVSGDVEELRLGELVWDNVPSEALSDMQDEATAASTEALEDVGIVAVERDGRWYVSLWYSVAELARRGAGEPLPAFGQGPAPRGGETPEDTLRQIAAEAADLDLGGVISMLEPEEAAALYDYSTLFLDDADQAVAEFRADTPGFAASIDRLDLRSEIRGDDAEVWIDGIAVSAAGADEGFTLDTAADCILFSFDQWNPDGECHLARSDFAGSDFASDNYWGFRLDIDDMPSPSVRMHLVDGRWYLSPTASVMEPMVEFMEALDPDQLRRWVENPDLLLEESDEVLATAPAAAGFAFLGVAAVISLGRTADQQFDDVSEAFGVEGAQVWVYVIHTDVAEGTPGAAVAASVELTPVPAALVPDTAVFDLAELDGAVAVADLAAGQILVDSVFTTP